MNRAEEARQSMDIRKIKNVGVVRRVTKSTQWALFRSWTTRGKLNNHALAQDESDLSAAPPLKVTGLTHLKVGVVPDQNDGRVSYTKYLRFLETNSIPHQLIEIHRSDWLRQAQECDCLVWHVPDDPAGLAEARYKIALLEDHAGIPCFPSRSEVFKYEDKVVQTELLKLLGFPVIETFITHSRAEALEFAANATYPLVSKVQTSSASIGVELIPSRKQAESLIRSVFSWQGRLSRFPYLRQKGYVYLQAFRKSKGYDLRVIVVGNRVFGYYRLVPKGDFRASGMGIYEKKVIPTQALMLATQVAGVLGGTILAVDLLETEEGEFQIIEVSTFFGIDTAEQLMVDGVPGSYIVNESGDEFQFEPGRYWLQELTLETFLKKIPARG